VALASYPGDPAYAGTEQEAASAGEGVLRENTEPMSKPLHHASLVRAQRRDLAGNPSLAERRTDNLPYNDTCAMVAIIKCVGVEKILLDSNERFYSRLGEEWVWRPVRRRQDWERDRGSGLTLIVADDKIIKLGWTSRRGWEGASGQKLEVSRIESVVPPVPYARVTRRLAPPFGRISHR
jgi:hypothetical protein